MPYGRRRTYRARRRPAYRPRRRVGRARAPIRRRYGRGRPRRFAARSTQSYSIGFPDYRTARFRYVDAVGLTVTAGVMSTFEYYCNGMYDPQVSVGGHQPMGYDQLFTFYNYAIVTGSKITVRFTCSDSSLSLPMVCGVYGPYSIGETTPPTSWVTMKETGEPATFLIAQSTRPVQVKNTFSFKKFFKTTPFGSLQQTANTAAANALRLAAWGIWVQPIDLASSVEKIFATVQIDYAVRLTNKQQLIAS